MRAREERLHRARQAIWAAEVAISYGFHALERSAAPLEEVDRWRVRRAQDSGVGAPARNAR
jgi:hypothetical protein